MKHLKIHFFIELWSKYADVNYLLLYLSNPVRFFFKFSVQWEEKVKLYL